MKETIVHRRGNIDSNNRNNKLQNNCLKSEFWGLARLLSLGELLILPEDWRAVSGPHTWWLTTTSDASFQLSLKLMNTTPMCPYPPTLQALP